MSPAFWTMVGIVTVATPVAAWFIWRVDRRHGGDDLAFAAIEALQVLYDDKQGNTEPLTDAGRLSKDGQSARVADHPSALRLIVSASDRRTLAWASVPE